MGDKAVRRSQVSKRQLLQPGPIAPQRFESFEGPGRKFEFTLEPGLNINDAIAGPLKAENIRAASLVIEGGGFLPLHYLMPALSTDGVHAAWYSDRHSPSGKIGLESGNVTFGERDGAAFIHCHALWIEPDGSRRVGHILPHETIVSEPIQATAWGVENIAMISEPDTETGFTLFHPVQISEVVSHGVDSRLLMARVGPNEDIIETLETICRKHGIAKAILRGSIGSLIGAHYTDGSSVDDIATEVFVRQGMVTANASATALEIMMVDTQGEITTGFLKRGENPVCITFELCLEESA